MIPSLPTDNLYKFLTVGGIALLVTGTLISFQANETRVDKIVAINKEITAIEKSVTEKEEAIEEYKYLSSKILDSMAFEVDSLEKILKAYADSADPTGILWMKKDSARRAHVSKLMLQDSAKSAYKVTPLSEIINKTHKLIRDKKITRQLDNIEHELNVIKEAWNQLRFLSYYLLVIGTSMTGFGFAKWSLYQNKLDRIFQNSLLEEQRKYFECQSCGTDLELIEVNQNRIYCQYCYSYADNVFKNPKMTLERMKKNIKEVMVKQGFNETEISRYLQNLPSLRRWDRRFKW